MMKHPIEKYNEQQAKFLEGLSSEERPFHDRLFRIGNASYCYYQQSNKEVAPTEPEYHEWLSGLPDNIGHDMKAKGFEKCKTNISFLRYLLEKRDIGLGEWMQRHLSIEDYNWWQSQK